MKVQIVLKGLKPNTDDYISHTLIIEGLTNQEIDDNITHAIYVFRNEHGYYKIKYMSKEIICEVL